MKIVLEGRPGIGKTRVARRLAELLLEDGHEVTGFIAEEIRGAGGGSGSRSRPLTEGERGLPM
jgi:nucleoside-triphosphatase THEP1